MFEFRFFSCSSRLPRPLDFTPPLPSSFLHENLFTTQQNEGCTPLSDLALRCPWWVHFCPTITATLSRLTHHMVSVAATPFRGGLYARQGLPDIPPEVCCNLVFSGLLTFLLNTSSLVPGSMRTSSSRESPTGLIRDFMTHPTHLSHQLVQRRYLRLYSRIHCSCYNLPQLRSTERVLGPGDGRSNPPGQCRSMRRRHGRYYH